MAELPSLLCSMWAVLFSKLPETNSEHTKPSPRAPAKIKSCVTVECPHIDKHPSPVFHPICADSALHIHSLPLFLLGRSNRLPQQLGHIFSFLPEQAQPPSTLVMCRLDPKLCLQPGRWGAGLRRSSSLVRLLPHMRPLHGL